MRAILISTICIALIAWFCHPYLTRASERPQFAPATEPSISSDTTPGAPATQPALDFKQVNGHANYWRLVEDNSGVWWFYSPENRQEFLNTVTTVQPYQFSRDKDGPHFVSKDWSDDKTDANAWAVATLKRVNDAGFKGLGAWCNPAFHNLNVPMTQDLNVWAWIDDAAKRFYTPDWQAKADLAIKTQVSPLTDNKNLVGYFIDNELDWGDAFAGPGAYFDHLPLNDPNRKQVLDVIHEQWKSIEDFNLAWNTRLKDWSEVEEMTTLPREPAHAYSHLGSAWLNHLAHDYFQATTSIIRKYDPNHLILGVRFKGYAPREVVSASKGLTDAQSLNYYVGDAKLDPDMFRMMNADSGQPIIISEYSFHSLDGNSGNRDVVGFAAQVPDQQARADGYKLMTTRLARVPYIVGADWFQWCDEPANGRGDGEDVNFGVVDVKDQPYPLLVDAIRKTTPLLNPLHRDSSNNSQVDVWRESYATKPVMHVPFLIQKPNLDGPLSAWSKESRLNGIRRDQTIGLDRSTVQTPNVYLGWTADGLYLAVEVFDKNITAAPAKGWWWTRDNVEWWISTRPVASDQTSYDVNCHQFFFVPNDLSEKNGIPGVVGQWHRGGDAIKDNLIPHAEIKSSVKILPDRYTVQFLIPASAMHGFDPLQQPALAFNIHVRDFQSAADFFWSAPTSIQTQLRPNTWGSLYLDAPIAENTAQARAQ